jgi:sporulation protein YlmC with PRC-barrel domain
MIRKGQARVCASAIFAAAVLVASSAFAEGMKSMRGGATSSGQAVQASQIIGNSVKTMNGETIGEIENLVVDPRSGRILLATVSVGGFLGVAETTYPVPWQAIQFRTREGMAGTPSARQQPPAGGYGGGPPGTEPGGTLRQAPRGERRGVMGAGFESVSLVLDVTKEKLQNAPKLENAEQLEDPGYLQRVYSHYGMQAPQGSGMGSGR